MNLALPIIASAHGNEIDQIIYIMHGLMFVLFVGWGIFFVIVLWRFNHRAHPRADYTGVKNHYSSVIEVAVIIAEIILLVGFSIPFWAKKVNAFPNRPDALEIRVVAEQFAWNVHYPGKDGKFGKTNPKFVNQQTNPVGLDLKDSNAKDDITTVNQLHIPIGRPVIIYLTTKDVIHSFSIPVMRVKQDVLPGMSIQTWFTPTKTGQWEIGCAQLCGLGHYRMKGFITVHTEKEFEDWLAKQPTAGGSSAGGDSFWN
ncbi:MAG: cytochrome c oxidase subunit II [Candidatus Omnitrophica bacterium]|nr:cytochrome c oxidase subunit II [Candidatus Omnitrophota bacterium]